MELKHLYYQRSSSPASGGHQRRAVLEGIRVGLHQRTCPSLRLITSGGMRLLLASSAPKRFFSPRTRAHIRTSLFTFKRVTRQLLHIRFTVTETAQKVKDDFGTIDFVVHSLANGPEVITLQHPPPTRLYHYPCQTACVHNSQSTNRVCKCNGDEPVKEFYRVIMNPSTFVLSRTSIPRR
eukprot:1189656-Prorocentrum_minimum.AAC.2